MPNPKLEYMSSSAIVRRPNHRSPHPIDERGFDSLLQNLMDMYYVYDKSIRLEHCVSPPTHTSSDHATRAQQRHKVIKEIFDGQSKISILTLFVLATDIYVRDVPVAVRVVGQPEGSRRYAWIHGIRKKQQLPSLFCYKCTREYVCCTGTSDRYST